MPRTPWVLASALSGAAVDFCVTLKTAHSLWLDLQGPMQFLTLELYKTRGQAVTSASPNGIQPELEGICATTTKLHLREKLLLSL